MCTLSRSTGKERGPMARFINSLCVCVPSVSDEPLHHTTQRTHQSKIGWSGFYGQMRPTLNFLDWTLSAVLGKNQRTSQNTPYLCGCCQFHPKPSWWKPVALCKTSEDGQAVHLPAWQQPHTWTRKQSSGQRTGRWVSLSGQVKALTEKICEKNETWLNLNNSARKNEHILLLRGNWTFRCLKSFHFSFKRV